MSAKHLMLAIIGLDIFCLSGRRLFQSLLFPSIQLTRVALKYLAWGQITPANNKTYKKATSRAGIFVWFRGMNILKIIYPRNRELERRLPALQCHGIASILLTLTLSFFAAPPFTFHMLCWYMQYLLSLSITFLCPSWKDGTIQAPDTILPLAQSLWCFSAMPQAVLMPCGAPAHIQALPCLLEALLVGPWPGLIWSGLICSSWWKEGGKDIILLLQPDKEFYILPHFHRGVGT